MSTLFLRQAASVIGVTLLLAGCNSQYATGLKLTQQMTQVTKETADLLATVTDKASASLEAEHCRHITTGF